MNSERKPERSPKPKHTNQADLSQNSALVKCVGDRCRLAILVKPHKRLASKIVELCRPGSEEFCRLPKSAATTERPNRAHSQAFPPFRNCQVFYNQEPERDASQRFSPARRNLNALKRQFGRKKRNLNREAVSLALKAEAGKRELQKETKAKFQAGNRLEKPASESKLSKRQNYKAQEAELEARKVPT